MLSKLENSGFPVKVDAIFDDLVLLYHIGTRQFGIKRDNDKAYYKNWLTER